ncbi:MAG: hypothetical protein EOO52_08280 [Gammaproteobacteria bacterium]|nr:MAG: hypothetical protein EOO52_08280 [Gammaproteobacteria bacterium]
MNQVIDKEINEKTKSGLSNARKKYRSVPVFFQNTIRSHGACGPAMNRSGFKQYLINKDDQNRYRVTVVSTWINSQTGSLESYTKIFTSEPSGEIYLGCDYQHMTGNGNTRITRKITREVKIE